MVTNSQYRYLCRYLILVLAHILQVHIEYSTLVSVTIPDAGIIMYFTSTGRVLHPDTEYWYILQERVEYSTLVLVAIAILGSACILRVQVLEYEYSMVLARVLQEKVGD